MTCISTRWRGISRVTASSNASSCQVHVPVPAQVVYIGVGSEGGLASSSPWAYKLTITTGVINYQLAAASWEVKKFQRVGVGGGVRKRSLLLRCAEACGGYLLGCCCISGSRCLPLGSAPCRHPSFCPRLPPQVPTPPPFLCLQVTLTHLPDPAVGFQVSWAPLQLTPLGGGPSQPAVNAS